jgi:hypothetical protein
MQLEHMLEPKSNSLSFLFAPFISILEGSRGGNLTRMTHYVICPSVSSCRHLPSGLLPDAMALPYCRYTICFSPQFQRLRSISRNQHVPRTKVYLYPRLGDPLRGRGFSYLRQSKYFYRVSTRLTQYRRKAPYRVSRELKLVMVMMRKLYVKQWANRGYHSSLSRILSRSRHSNFAPAC